MLKSSIRLGLALLLLPVPARLLAMDPPNGVRVATIYNPAGPQEEQGISPALRQALDTPAGPISLAPGAEVFAAAAVSCGFEIVNQHSGPLLMCAHEPDEEALATTYYLGSSRDGWASVSCIKGADDLRRIIKPGETLAIVVTRPTHTLPLIFMKQLWDSEIHQVQFQPLDFGQAAPGEPQEEKKGS